MPGAFGSSVIHSLALTSPKLTSLDTNALSGCSALRSLVIGSTGSLFVAGGNFTSVALTNVVFLGPAQSQATMDQILNKVAAGTATHGCTIYASIRQTGWTDMAADMTEAEKPNAPAKCFGVYVTASGVRKAWLVHQTSPYDPKAGVIIVR